MHLMDTLGEAQPLPMMLIGMVGIILVIGIIVLAVMLLNRLTGRK